MTLSGSFGNQRNHAGIVVLACVFLQAKRFHAHPDKIATRTALLAFQSFCVFLRAQQKQTRISAYAYSHYFPLSGI